MKVKEESEKVGFKLNIQKTKIMASGSNTSWQIDGKTMETVIDFMFCSSKITADGDCGHEIKRCLLLGRKAMTNLDSILKSRDITLPTKIRLVEAMVFPVVMYGCESWTIKKAECRSIWPPDVKSWLTGKDPDAGKDWRQEKGTTEDEMVGWHHRFDDMSLSKLQELVRHRKAWRAAVHVVTKSWKHWATELNNVDIFMFEERKLIRNLEVLSCSLTLPLSFYYIGLCFTASYVFYWIKIEPTSYS